MIGPTVVYHVAAAERRDDIGRWGLSAEDVSDRNHSWCDRGVYLWASREAAEAWAASPRRGYLGAHADIWWVDLGGWDGDVHEDSYRHEQRADSSYQESLFTTDDIAPGRLTLAATRGPVVTRVSPAFAAASAR